MKSRRNPQLSEFVADVRKVQNSKFLTDIPLMPVQADLAIAAADYIESRLAAAAKGGRRAARKKPGRPITSSSRVAEQTRARVRKLRAARKKK